MTKITLNGREIDADPSKPLVEACRQHAQQVPIYCYHPGLEPVGSCRICQVEVQQGNLPPRVVVACRTPITEGMVVDTEAPTAHEARRQCLEFLLKDHPLDCPICDKAGECDLQDYAFHERQGEGRSVEPRRKLQKRKSLGDVILLDEERCILCSRCVRFFENVTGKAQLTVAGLGSRSVISTFMDRPLEGNYQGNLADVCPVGALTLKKFRFQARVWNLGKHPSTCGECSRGCSTTVEVLRRRDVKRVRPRYNPRVNKWWMCDEGRFAFPRWGSTNRLGPALVRGGDGLEAADVEEALDVAAHLLSGEAPGAKPAILASPWLTVEEGELLAELTSALGAPALVVTPPANDLADELLHTGEPCPNRRGLTDLGFETVPAGEAQGRLEESECTVLVGERIASLFDVEALARVSAAKHLVVFDTEPLDVPATRVCIGVPNCVERGGTWVNVDGVRGALSAARPAPEGVLPLERSLGALLERTRTAGATGR